MKKGKKIINKCILVDNERYMKKNKEEKIERQNELELKNAEELTNGQSGYNKIKLLFVYGTSRDGKNWKIRDKVDWIEKQKVLEHEKEK